MNDDVKKITAQLESDIVLQKDKNGNGYVAINSNNQEVYRINQDNNVLYNIGDDEYILLKSPTIFIIPNTNKCGTYKVDKDHNIICYERNGKIEKYNHDGLVILDGGEDIGHYNYKDVTISMTDEAGHTRYTKDGHIEYKEEEYQTLMQDLINAKNDFAESIESACASIDAALASIQPEPFSGNADGIRSAANAGVDQICNLKDNINCTLLAYDACDKNLYDDVRDYLTKSLFDENDAHLGNEIRKFFLPSNDEDEKRINKYNVKYKNGGEILEYSEETDFKMLGKDLKDAIEYDKMIDEQAESIKLILGFNNNIKNVSQGQIKNELYSLEDKDDGKLLAGILNVTSRLSDRNDYNGYYVFSSSRGLENYDYNVNTIGNYDRNSELVIYDVIDRYNPTITHNYDIEFAKAVPSNCTSVEKLAYDIIKCDVINAIGELPGEMIKKLSAKEVHIGKDSYETNNVIVLTGDKNSQKTNFNVGYTGVEDGTNPSSGTIVIDMHDLLINANNPGYLKDITTRMCARKSVEMLKNNGSYNLSYNHRVGVEQYFNKHKDEEGFYADIDTLYEEAEMAYLKRDKSLTQLKNMFCEDLIDDIDTKYNLYKTLKKRR